MSRKCTRQSIPYQWEEALRRGKEKLKDKCMIVRVGKIAIVATAFTTCGGKGITLYFEV